MSGNFHPLVNARGAPPDRPTRVAAYLSLLRPKTLTVGLSPVLLGAIAASREGPVAPSLVLLCALGAASLQIVSNIANDVFDAKKGADGPDRLGPPRAVASGWLSEAEAMRALVVAALTATIVGLSLVAVGGWPILLIGVSGLISAIAYTGGPYPLGYHGLGDLFVLLYFGFAAVMGTAFVLGAGWTPLSALLGLSAGCFGMAVLAVNNIRDQQGDARVGKRTLVVRLGDRGGRLLYAAELLLPFVVLGAAMALRLLPLGAAGALLAVPVVVKNVMVARSATDGPTLNALLGKTAASQLIYVVGMGLGVVFS